MSPLVQGRVAGRLALLLCAVALAFAGCGPKDKGPKHPKTEKNTGPSAEKLLAEARAAAQAGDAAGADAKYTAAFQLKNDIQILVEQTTVMIELQRVDLAVTDAKAYYDAHPTDSGGIHLYAHVLIAAGDFATALEVADELLALDDNDADAHYKKGEALVLANDVQAGVEELRRAVQLDGQNVAFVIELGSALHRAGKVDEAALQFRSAIKLDPDNGRALMLLGLALRDQMELEEAEVFLVQATKKSSDARPWFELGITQNKRGDDLGAEESLAKAVAIEPNNSLYQYAYGEMLRINKHYDAAITAYQTAADLNPPHPKAASKLGVALFEAKRYSEAEVSITEAIRADPSNAYNYYNLAIVYREQKKTKLAIDMYQQFLAKADKSDGDRPKAESCLKALKRGKKC
jgi:tetratricopeptide (TPR) repeat protein